MTLCYLDASALVKLVTTESETAALRDYLASAESLSHESDRHHRGMARPRS